MENMPEQNQKKNNTGYTKYILVWFTLIILTGLTVSLAGMDLGRITVATALLIASIKSSLVLSVFMHLKSEQKAFKVFVLVALFFIVVSFVLLFSDYSSY
ncbi:MAG: cytochrome C oxidase subunit IV family protein [Bacteroidota bacterium]|nr:cytochrome C oxidase subunit IV family protein [Bacteroidota bacterium]